MNVTANLLRYLEGPTDLDGRRPDARYSSFDYCFNYFQSFRESGNLEGLESKDNIQLSCLHLGFYLASWGMLRGSAPLLQKSARSLMPVIQKIARSDASLWDLDVHLYSETNIQRLLESAQSLRIANDGMTDVLVKKVMLGVFGSIPAFDQNFRRSLGVSSLVPGALRKIGSFYQDHAEVFDASRVPTLDFVTGQPTKRFYTRAKLIDMAFFIEGMPKSAKA